LNCSIPNSLRLSSCCEPAHRLETVSFRVRQSRQRQRPRMQVPIARERLRKGQSGRVTQNGRGKTKSLTAHPAARQAGRNGGLKRIDMIAARSPTRPCFTARETCEFAQSLGLLVCTTPAYSPQSNGGRRPSSRPSSAYVYIINCLLRGHRGLPAALPTTTRSPIQGAACALPREYLKAVS